MVLYRMVLYQLVSLLKAQNMKDSPFIYGNTVSNGAFTNRKKDIEKLYNNLTQGINTMIISPRRWGKSSLVEKVVNNINRKNKDRRIINIDLFSVSSEKEFLEAFAGEIIKVSSNKWEEWIDNSKSFFKQLIPKISFGIDPYTDFSLSFEWEELQKHSDEVLNLPEVIAKKKNFQFIICLDEFQSIASYPSFFDFEKKMRAVWQRQKSVTFCLYGSKRHMMTDIFNNPSKPFYRFGDIILLDKINTKDWIIFIRKGFEKTGKVIEKADAEIIPKLMKNHPWYVQQLAHYTWNLTSEKASVKEIKKALDEVINANTPFYQKEIETMSPTQINLLKAVASNKVQFTSTEVMQKYKLGTPRNVLKNKKVLIKNDIIDDAGGAVSFLDPAFEIWFKKQFFNQSYEVQIWNNP